MKAQYFRRHEFECRCGCGKSTVDAELLQVLEQAREHFCRPIEITSGHRCAEHNRRIGGSPNSQHLDGKAADIKVIGMPASEVYEYFTHKYPDRYGLGLYPTWVHIDVRENPARWQG